MSRLLDSHDEFTIQVLEELVASSEDHVGQKHALDRRVPTRWSSEGDGFDAHILFKPEVEAITGQSANKLAAFRLSEKQWDLATELAELLLVSLTPKVDYSQRYVGCTGA